MPKFSIITINYNNATGLRKTMESVLHQSFKDFEYIVVDGASTDDSLEMIHQYDASTVYQFHWISELDNGIYDAMNKGIGMTTGDYLLFLNSGDELVNFSVLEKSSELINSATDICSGVLIMVEGDGDKRTVLAPVQELSLSYSMYGGLTHPNTFIRKSLFDKYGLYNKNNKIVSDWEFFLIAGGLHNLNYQAIFVPVSIFYMDGISSNPNNSLLVEEIKQAITRNIPAPVLKDIERLRVLENKMNQRNFKILEWIKKYPVLDKFISAQFKLLFFILKRNNR